MLSISVSRRIHNPKSRQDRVAFIQGDRRLWYQDRYFGWAMVFWVQLEVDGFNVGPKSRRIVWLVVKDINDSGVVEMTKEGPS